MTTPSNSEGEEARIWRQGVKIGKMLHQILQTQNALEAKEGTKSLAEENEAP